MQVDLEDFALARIEEEEESWRLLGRRDPAHALASEKGLRHCAERRAVKVYGKKPSRHLHAQLKQYALAYYAHPDYNDEWRPPSGPRWTSGNKSQS